ncbi:hypothetical protein GEMRC1_009712 [Eukaryota sp. GEM-RC1]
MLVFSTDRLALELFKHDPTIPSLNPLIYNLTSTNVSITLPSACSRFPKLFSSPFYYISGFTSGLRTGYVMDSSYITNLATFPSTFRIILMFCCRYIICFLVLTFVLNRSYFRFVAAKRLLLLVGEAQKHDIEVNNIQSLLRVVGGRAQSIDPLSVQFGIAFCLSKFLKMFFHGISLRLLTGSIHFTPVLGSLLVNNLITLKSRRIFAIYILLVAPFLSTIPLLFPLDLNIYTSLLVLILGIGLQMVLSLLIDRKELSNGNLTWKSVIDHSEPFFFNFLNISNWTRDTEEEAHAPKDQLRLFFQWLEARVDEELEEFEYV